MTQQRASLLITNTDQVLEVLKRIRDCEIFETRLAPIQGLQCALTIARRAVQSRTFSGDWVLWFVHVGALVYAILKDYPFSPKDFAELLHKKHRLYGAECLTAWGETGILIRLDSKLHRFVHILNNRVDTSSTDESLVDTLQDMLGYCILGVLMCEKKDTPRKEED